MTGAEQTLLFEEPDAEAKIREGCITGTELPGEACRLAGLALSLGAADRGDLSAAEQRIADHAVAAPKSETLAVRRAVLRGLDPLGTAFCDLFSPSSRRDMGATYTPAGIVAAMLRWSEALDATPARIVDPGAGSGRFVLAAAARWPDAALVAIETDPLSSLLLRANLAVRGFSGRATVLTDDYRACRIGRTAGRTLFFGNPPYVRHHGIEPAWKRWLTDTATRHGLRVSQLAGLHAHFYLATLLHAKPGDVGAFITSAEWLDVNYGKLIRDLFRGPLGGLGLAVMEPTADPFPDAATTGAVATFRVGSSSRSVTIGRIAEPSQMTERFPGRVIHRDRLADEDRWTHLTRRRQEPGDWIELGELCRVHRGTVTGANKFWIEGDHTRDLPEEYFFASVTRAKELFSAGDALTSTAPLRRVVDLPTDLDDVGGAVRARVEKFLGRARQAGVKDGYVASNRRAWWSVGLRKPAPILATYMARRPPAFVRNLADARHINIAHGLYPRDTLPEPILVALGRFLSTRISVASGRTYAGGLTKFEPREMERLLIPRPEALVEGAA